MSVAVVTGSDSGIGRATAVRLAQAGMAVGITWHTDEEGAESTADEVRATGRRAAVARLDLTDLPDAAQAVDTLAEALGGLDVLVNNAGTGTSTPFLVLDHTTVRQVLDVDLIGPFLCSQRAARRMIEQGRGGRIINVTSAEHQPRVGAAPYCAAKEGPRPADPGDGAEAGRVRHHRQCGGARGDRHAHDRPRGRGGGTQGTARHLAGTAR